MTTELNVVVVGGGIAGLAAAIALRRAGHSVRIVERSKFMDEVGAAIHLCPNGTRILDRWGMDPARARFVAAKRTRLASADSLDVRYTTSYDHIEPTYGARWYLTHRVDLHDELKRLATQKIGIGNPVQIQLDREVTSYDPEAGIVVCADGSSLQGDLIVAADGVHSRAVSVVTGEQAAPSPTGESAFRFLIPSETLLKDPETAPFLDDADGLFRIFIGNGHNRLVWYPCRDNNIQNFVGIHSDQDDESTREDWSKRVGQDELLAEFHDFHPLLQKVCEKATKVNKWKLLYRPPLPIWKRGRLILIGDAAHPMLPHQAQGGCQALEDGAALGVVFSQLTQSDEDTITTRLELFERVRKNRASAMQILSGAAQDQAETIQEVVRPYITDGPIPTNPAEFVVFNFTHDVVKESEKQLKGFMSASSSSSSSPKVVTAVEKAPVLVTV